MIFLEEMQMLPRKKYIFVQDALHGLVIQLTQRSFSHSSTTLVVQPAGRLINLISGPATT